MEINYNIVSFIDSLGVVQGIILGILLIIINKKRSKSTLLLGIFIICFALDTVPVILEDLTILEHYPEYTLLPFSFSWLLFPIFYVYVQQVSILTQHKTSYWVLIPGVTVLLINVALFFQNTDLKIKIDDSLWYDLLELCGVIYSIIIGFYTIKWINKHTQILKDQYTLLEYKELQWAKLFVLVGLSYTFIVLFVEIFTETDYYFDIMVSAIDVMILYWVSLKGILQQNAQSLIKLSSSKNNSSSFLETDESYSITPQQDYSCLIQKLDKYMINEKAFRKEDLTIIDVAEKIGVHPKKISTAINSQLRKNFNTYVNSYRIENAKELLKSDTFNHMSVEGIGYEVGFQSKSTFYDAFKKHTKTTPSRYKSS